MIKQSFRKHKVAYLVGMVTIGASSLTIANDYNPYLEDRVNVSGVQSPLNLIEWTVTGVPEDVNFSHVSTAGDPRQIAVQAITEIRKKGYLDRYVHVDQQSGLIEIRQADATIEGPLARFLPDSIEGDALGKRLPLLRRAADAYNGTPDIQVGQIQNGILPVNAGVREKDQRFNSGVTVSSYGSRYAGTDTASVFTYGSPVDGYIARGSFSYGLSDARSDSKGGHYYGLSLGLDRPEPFGIMSVNYRYSDSKQGGVYLPLDMIQRVHAGDLTWSYPILNGGYSAGLKVVDQHMKMRAIELEADQRYQALFAEHHIRKGFNQTDPSWFANVRFDHTVTAGLNSETSGILYGLGAKNNWLKYEANLNYEQRLKSFHLSTHVGLQWSDTEWLPNHEKFYLGGPRRGNAYYAGVASTHQGAYASARLYMPTMTLNQSEGLETSLRPYLGYNQSIGKTAHQGNIEAKSAEVGIKLNIGSSFVGDLSYAKRINDDFNPTDNSRVLFNISYLF